MERKEFAQILAAVLLMFLVFSVGFVLSGNYDMLAQIFLFSILVIAIPVFVKKGMAYLLDSDVEHEIWHSYRFGYKPQHHYKKPRPFGIIVPLFFMIIGLLFMKVPIFVLTFLTYEARALKHRAAKRFGHYSYTSMTDWHNGLIGAAGVVSLLLISAFSYLSGLELLSKISAYYAFWSIFPVSKLDGTQIFFGNRILWIILFFISLVFALYALLLPM